MDNNEQQSDLSRELEKTDQLIRIERLKREAESLRGRSLLILFFELSKH